MTLRLNKFCCCCTTRTGALVIGTLGWILTLLQLFAGQDPSEAQRQEKVRNNLYNDSQDDDGHGFQNNIYFKIGYGSIAFLVCVLLVVGVYKKDKRFILPWLVLKGLEIILVAIGAAILFVMACMYGIGLLFALFFLVLLMAVLHSYFWLCIWSHYKDLGEEPVANSAMYSAANTAPPLYTGKSLNMA